MAIIKAISSTASIGRAISYVTDPEKTEELLVSGKDCSPEHATDEMKATKQLWGKEGGREYLHIVQSFDEKITPQEANEIGVQLAEKSYPGHEVLIATHTDTQHVHNHLIVNSVNHETGLKLQMSKDDLESIKKTSDTICQERGLSITQKGQEITSFNQKKYKAIERDIKGKGEYKSHLVECCKAVIRTKNTAISRTDFIEKMDEKGYKTTWSDERKYITFEDKEGNKIRNSNLEKTFKESFGKEELENGFKRNVVERQRGDISRRDSFIAEQTINIANREAGRVVPEAGGRDERAESIEYKTENREQQFTGRNIDSEIESLDGKQKVHRLGRGEEKEQGQGISRNNTHRTEQNLDLPITRDRGKGRDIGR